MIQLPHIKARVVRLRQVVEGLGWEVTAQRAARLLTAAELRQYLNVLQDALADLDEARVVLAAVVKRMKKRR